MSARRVVVTGFGLISPLGVGAPYNWINLTNGMGGITKVKDESFQKVRISHRMIIESDFISFKDAQQCLEKYDL